MKKVIFAIIFCFLVSASFAGNERRFQIWNKNEVIIHPWKNILIDLAEKVHYSPQRNAADIKYVELFVLHKPMKWFEYGAGFRVAKANLYPGWLQENRAMLNANFSKNYNQFNFKFSNRFEYRDFDNDLHHFRYRQEFKIDFPALTTWGMQFYTSEEAFFKLNGIGLHLARFYGGLSVVQIKHFNLKMYYALEKYKLIENWTTTDIVGLNLSVIF